MHCSAFSKTEEGTWDVHFVSLDFKKLLSRNEFGFTYLGLSDAIHFGCSTTPFSIPRGELVTALMLSLENNCFTRVQGNVNTSRLQYDCIQYSGFDISTPPGDQISTRANEYNVSSLRKLISIDLRSGRSTPSTHDHRPRQSRHLL